jgi:hypothetical protein
MVPLDSFLTISFFFLIQNLFRFSKEVLCKFVHTTRYQWFPWIPFCNQIFFFNSKSFSFFLGGIVQIPPNLHAQTVPFDPLSRSDDHTSLSLRDVAERQHCSKESRLFISAL